MKNENIIGSIVVFGPLVFSLLAYFIVNYFDLFTPSYFDIALIDDLYKFSSHPNLFSFIWTGHLLLSPFVLLYAVLFASVDSKQSKLFIEKYTVSGLIIPFLFFLVGVLIYICLISFHIHTYSEDPEDSFDSFIVFYIVFLLPLTILPYIFGHFLKMLCTYKFLLRS